MKLKTNLHFHAREDEREKHIAYSLKEGIDHAASLGFDVLAVTCHHAHVATDEHKTYAEERGILLIPGIELDIEDDPHKKGKHLIILNADKEAENVHTFSDLAHYRKKRDDIFVLAPHPYFYGNFSLKHYLEKYIHLVDGIEHSWFYSTLLNRNRKAIEVARKNNLPVIATSDTHFLGNNHMEKNYTLIDAEEKSIPAVFDALRKHHLKNITEPSNTIKDMFLRQGCFIIKGIWQKTLKNI